MHCINIPPPSLNFDNMAWSCFPVTRERGLCYSFAALKFRLLYLYFSRCLNIFCPRSQLRKNCRCATTCGGVLWVWIPALFSKRIKVSCFLENREISPRVGMTTRLIALESNLARECPLISLPFLCQKGNSKQHYNIIR